MTRNGNFKLTKHFQLYEVTQSATAARKGIDNTLPEKYLDNAIMVCKEILEPARGYYGIPFSPNSFYRCPELNRAVGGSTTSRHLTASAVDLEINTISNYDLAVWLSQNVLFDKIILENYTPGVPRSGWVHASVDVRRERNRKLLYTYAGGEYRKGLFA